MCVSSFPFIKNIDRLEHHLYVLIPVHLQREVGYALFLDDTREALLDDSGALTYARHRDVSVPVGATLSHRVRQGRTASTRQGLGMVVVNRSSA